MHPETPCAILILSLHYNPEPMTPDIFYSAGLRGQLPSEVASSLGIPHEEVQAAMHSRADLREAYDRGWDDHEHEATLQARHSLLRRARGYSVTERRVKVDPKTGLITEYDEEVVHPPNVEALKFLLERRDRKRYGATPAAPTAVVNIAYIQQASERIGRDISKMVEVKRE